MDMKRRFAFHATPSSVQLGRGWPAQTPVMVHCVVGAGVRCPHHRGRAGRGAAAAVEGGAGAAVDDLVAVVAEAGQRPLLVVAAVPRRLPGGSAVGGVAPAVGGHAVGAVDDAVVAVAEVDQLPLQVGAAVVVPLLEVGAGGDVAAAVEDQSAGHVGDLHPGGGAARRAQDGDLTGEGELDRVRQGAERRVGRGHGQVQAGGVLGRCGQVDVGAGGVVQQLRAGQAAEVDLVRSSAS